jgi:hypothetical protein
VRTRAEYGVQCWGLLVMTTDGRRGPPPALASSTSVLIGSDAKLSAPRAVPVPSGRRASTTTPMPASISALRRLTVVHAPAELSARVHEQSTPGAESLFVRRTSTKRCVSDVPRRLNNLGLARDAAAIARTLSAMTTVRIGWARPALPTSRIGSDSDPSKWRTFVASDMLSALGAPSLAPAAIDRATEEHHAGICAAYGEPWISLLDRRLAEVYLASGRAHWIRQGIGLAEQLSERARSPDALLGPLDVYYCCVRPCAALPFSAMKPASSALRPSARRWWMRRVSCTRLWSAERSSETHTLRWKSLGAYAGMIFSAKPVRTNAMPTPVRDGTCSLDTIKRTQLLT